MTRKFLQLAFGLLILSLCSYAQDQKEVDKLRLTYNEYNAVSKQNSVTVSNDGKLIAFAYENKTIKILNAFNGRVIKKLAGVHDRFFELRFNKDATKLISVGEKDNVAFIDVKSGKVEKQFDVPNKISRVAVSRAENLVAFGTLDAHVYVYDMDTYQQKCHIDRKKHHVSGLDFDPRGGKIAIAVMPTLRQANPVTIHDVNNGIQLDEINKGFYCALEYNEDGSQIYLSGLKGTSATFIGVYNTDSRFMDIFYKSTNWVSMTLYANVVKRDNSVLGVSIDKAFEVIDIASGEKTYTTKREKTKMGQAYAKMGNDIKRIYPLYDGKSYLINYSSNNINQIYSAETGNIAAFIYSDANDDLVVAARDGRMDGTAEAMANIFWSQRKSTKQVPLEATFDQFYTPGLLPELLSGEAKFSSDEALDKAIELAPLCSITAPDSLYSTQNSKVTLTIDATANGDPVKEIKLFVNGKSVSTDTRGFKAAGQSYEINVLPGKNIVTAVAVSEGGYQSLADQVVVTYEGQMAQANLFVMAVGIDVYKNPAYNLNYAYADATAFTDKIKNQSQSIFGNVDIQFITNSDATKDNVMTKLNDIKARIQQQDVFVFYYAGHGVMNEGNETVASDFFLALHDVTQLYGRDEMLVDKGISAAELRDYFGKIPAQKQLIVLDACQSGGAVETFARRGAAEEKAMIQLARSAGVVLMASTGSEQYASEFVQLGHGVFTYALLEGLGGKADGGTNDKKITVKELESFIQDSVPELTEQYKGTMQFPRSWAKGQDFPLVIAE